MSDDQIAWVELLGIPFSGAVSPDDGMIWSDLEGWRGLPDSRGEGDLIPGANGRFRRARVLRESRVITFTGAIFAADNGELMAACDRLEEALGGGAGPMRVATESAGVWERYVEIDTLVIDPDHGRRWTKFTIDMIAPDPYRYAEPVMIGPVDLPSSVGGLRLPARLPWNLGTTSDGGRLMVNNSGGVDLAPLISVSGGFTAVTVRELVTGRRVRLELPVSEGEQVTFDMGARTVDYRGNDVSRWMTARQWVEIPKGETFEFRFEVEGRIGDPQMWADIRIGAW